jgi:tRNA(adenine34) deaminase
VCGLPASGLPERGFPAEDSTLKDFSAPGLPGRGLPENLRGAPPRGVPLAEVGREPTPGLRGPPRFLLLLLIYPDNRPAMEVSMSLFKPLREGTAAGDPLSLAFAEAKAAAERGEVPVGAVIACQGEILAAAGNRTRADRDPTAHAELLAIRAAALRFGSERLAGCDLYVTLEPCAMCAGAISFARLRRLYYSAPDPKGGAVEHGPRFFAQPTCHHVPEVYGGLREREAADLLRGFFAARRD